MGMGLCAFPHHRDCGPESHVLSSIMLIQLYKVTSMYPFSSPLNHCMLLDEIWHSNVNT